MKFVVAAAILFVSQGVVATSVLQRSTVANFLAARQAAPPSTPPMPNGLGDCTNVCTDWANIVNPCYNVTETNPDYNAILSCVCTDQVVDGWVQCYDCLIPLVAQEGDDPNFQSESQTGINEFTQNCDESGHKVNSATLSGSSGGGSPSTPSGNAPSPFASGNAPPPSASGSSGSGGSGSSGGSGGNGGSSKGNGASSSWPTVAALILGALGIFAGFL